MKPPMVLFAVLAIGATNAQSIISSANPGEPVRLLVSDAAVLDLQEPRDDFKCSVTPFKPELGFDFLFQAGYQVRVPLKELAGDNNMLTILLRVLSGKRKDQPVYFVQKLHVPAIEEHLAGDAVIDGVFRLGEGQYHVDWLIRDTAERVCARSWDTVAKVTGKELPLAEALAKDVIEPAESTLFYQEAPVERQPIDRPLNIKVIINFAPQNLEALTLDHHDLQGLVAILRKIGREPRIGSFSIVACSVQSQRVIYRQQREPNIDLPALGMALKTLNLAKVDAKQLALKNGEAEFLASVITEETWEDHPNALIFVSPKSSLEANVSPAIIARLKDYDHPVFYLNYSVNPYLYPWRDAIARIVKQLHGFEYTISRPQDLFSAWPDIMSRLLSAKQLAGSVSAAH